MIREVLQKQVDALAERFPSGGVVANWALVYEVVDVATGEPTLRRDWNDGIAPWTLRALYEEAVNPERWATVDDDA